MFRPDIASFFHSPRTSCFIALPFSFPLLNIELDLQKRSPTPPPDPVVDISDMYCMMIKREDIKDGYFITCQSHREVIEQQVQIFRQLSSDDNTFWVSTSPLFLFLIFFFLFFFLPLDFLPLCFWVASNGMLQKFVADKRRRARMSLHLKIESFIKQGIRFIPVRIK